MRIKSENTVVLAVDYQERIMPAIDRNEELTYQSAIFLQGIRALEIPIYVTQQYTKGLGMTISRLQEAAGTKEYYEKNSFSCMGEETIKEIFTKNSEIKNVILCGIEAHICVLQTAVDLQEMGLQTVLVADCISSRKEESKKYAFKRARQEGCILTTCEAILFELMESSANPAFKTISKLIK